MPEKVDHPVAVRATALIRPSRWLYRPMRLVRGYPADFDALRQSVHEHCPEVGSGQWVGECGGVVAGPTLPEPGPPENVAGTRWEYGASSYDAFRKVDRKVRVALVGCGLASLILGIYLPTGPGSDGFAGFAGVLCFIFGLSALSGLIARKFRRR